MAWTTWWISVLCAALVYIYRSNRWFRYNCKMTAYYILLMLISSVTIPYAMFRPKNARNHGLIMWLSANVIRPLFQLKVTVEGKENLPQSGPYIIICNHQSSIDTFVMSAMWPDNCTSISKKELMYAGPLGLCLWLMGTVFINRQRSNDARASLGDAVQRITQEKLRIWIFPEGTRNHDKTTMLPFKKGAFHLAIEAKVPLVPVVVASYESFYNKSECKFDGGGVIRVRCLPTVTVEHIQSSGITELSEDTRRTMLDEYNCMKQRHQ